ncbi:hypothetical protein CLV63_10815 [Murinocardiopsis flavida]|uniref:Mce-associated membrane protein n=1 Tax=Murinocardiopsis flavida TaxID=645275 RepID=A0A2P8DJ95_9ACTN|nr:hypothetical protein [Murinocardiopsis flavida]PSK97297.1 hypothetical protein CLV63_10815 [Murinocardiopsis flavida]
MPKPLSDTAQRLVFGTLVVALVAFGIYLSLGGFNGGGPGDGAGQDRESAGGGAGAASPSPIPTADTEDMKVLDWLPFEESELKSAAAVAQEFASAYGTIDYQTPKEDYQSKLESLAAKDYAKTLARSSGASALWGEKAKEKTVSEGRADVRSIRSFDDKSVVFVVKAQSISASESGETEELGDFAVTVIDEGGQWKVYDFQPADAANLGDG